MYVHVVLHNRNLACGIFISYKSLFNSQSVWEWPASERTPTKCKFDGSDEAGCWPGDANVELKQMGLQADDVFRLVEMTIFLVILMPISVRWFASRWHAATKLHRLINLIYFVDIVRRHSHPHSWVLNTPVFGKS